MNQARRKQIEKAIAILGEAASAITNDPRLVDARVLFVTGERAEESPNRARYALVEKHRTSTRRRVVDHWRIIGDWTEADQVLASTPWSLPSGAFQTCGGPN